MKIREHTVEGSIQNLILQILLQKVGNGYTILELQEIYDLLPADVSIQKSELNSILRQLQDEGYISIKYLDNETCCLSLLQMGRVQATKIFNSKNNIDSQSNALITMDKQGNIIENRSEKINFKNLAIQFSASFSGGFLAGIITLIIVLCSR